MTTSVNGNLNANFISNTPPKVVLNVQLKDDNDNSLYIGFPYLDTNSNGWSAHVVNITSSTQAQANKTVSGTYYYMFKNT